MYIWVKKHTENIWATCESVHSKKKLKKMKIESLTQKIESLTQKIESLTQKIESKMKYWTFWNKWIHKFRNTQKTYGQRVKVYIRRKTAKCEKMKMCHMWQKPFNIECEVKENYFFAGSLPIQGRHHLSLPLIVLTHLQPYLFVSFLDFPLEWCGAWQLS